MTRKLPAKRASRFNPREDRNQHQHTNVIDFREKIKKIIIVPKSLAQEQYLDALEDPHKTIVVATGPAGTGKSYLATMHAIRCLLQGQFKKIIITRPTVSTGEEIGFLPGDLYAKLSPWSVPILDIFKEIYSLATLERMIKDEVIEIAPLGMMRGRTLKHAVVIVDETQNATPSQVKMCLTRIGEGSRMFVTGDLNQHDRGFAINGLRDFIERLRRKTSGRIAICEFGITDIERHPVVEEVLRIYGDETW
jgi:phosphate starvation-inducible protein PhoH and related proteins